MGLRSWYNDTKKIIKKKIIKKKRIKKKAEYDPKKRARKVDKLQREVVVQQITDMNTQQQCPNAVTDLTMLEKKLDRGEPCDKRLDWWCEVEVANYRDKRDKGHLYPNAVEILNRILTKHTIRTVKQINEDPKNNWQVKLKF